MHGLVQTSHTKLIKPSYGSTPKPISIPFAWTWRYRVDKGSVLLIKGRSSISNCRERIRNSFCLANHDVNMYLRYSESPLWLYVQSLTTKVESADPVPISMPVVSEPSPA